MSTDEHDPNHEPEGLRVALRRFWQDAVPVSHSWINIGPEAVGELGVENPRRHNLGKLAIVFLTPFVLVAAAILFVPVLILGLIIKRTEW